MFKLTEVDTQKVHRLVDKKDDYMDTELPMKMAPVSPIAIVTRTHIAMRENSVAWRNRILLPVLLFLSVVCFFHVNSLYSFWLVLQEQSIEDIAGEKVRHGNHYFLESESVEDLTIYYRIDTSSAVSIGEFLNQRYKKLNDSLYTGYLKAQYFEWVVLLFYLLMLPYLLYQLLTFSRRAPLFFDRERQIVFTWRNGKVWMQHYSLIQTSSSTFSLSFFLYSLEQDSSLKERCYSLQPTGNLLLNGKAHYQHALAAICQFMEKGMGRVWYEEWAEKPGAFLRPDNMPANLYEQVSEIGEKLKAHS